MSAEDEIRGSGVREGAMQERFFDDLARGLASGTVSRRQTLRWMCGAIAGAMLASVPGVALGNPRGNKGGNSECAHFCNEVFTPGRERGECKSAAARRDKGNLCSECGADPARLCSRPDATGPVRCCPEGKTCCGSSACCGPGQNCCAGKNTCVTCEQGEKFNPQTCECVPAGQNPNPECAGATCDTFGPCSTGNPDCICVSIVSAGEVGGLCVPGSTVCASLDTCDPEDLSCPDGQLCGVDTCCGEPVCFPVELECAADQAAPITSAAAPEGPTIAGR